MICTCKKRDCSSCNSTRYKEHKKKNPEKYKQYAKNTRAKNLEKIKAKRMETYNKNKEDERKQNSTYCKKNRDLIYKKAITKKFKISIEDYDNLLESQKNLCAICKSPETLNQRLCLDHDHATNKVRGLLCTKCNKGLGLFKDDLNLISKAIKYLEDSK